MSTHYLSTQEALDQKKWLIVDAAGKTLGRLASEVARVLRGKHRPSFTPNQDCGDNVIVINAAQVHLTGSKLTDKIYHKHTGYVGGLKSISAGKLLSTFPDRVIRYAVEGMLPNGKLGRKISGNLKVYAGSTHPHTAQKPEVHNF